MCAARSGEALSVEHEIDLGYSPFDVFERVEIRMLSHVILGTNNVAAAVEFYNGVLGAISISTSTTCPAALAMSSSRGLRLASSLIP